MMIPHSAVRVPYPPYAWRIARTAALVWLVVRIAAAFATVLLPNFGSAVFLVGVSTLLVRLDLRRSHEYLFHANLGTSPVWSVGIALGVAGTLELLVQLVSRVLISASGGAFLG